MICLEMFGGSIANTTATPPIHRDFRGPTFFTGSQGESVAQSSQTKTVSAPSRGTGASKMSSAPSSLSKFWRGEPCWLPSTALDAVDIF